jgi:hypothetical protein
VADADLGPIRYLAALLGADSETALRWLVLDAGLLLDPAAVLLLAAATPRTRPRPRTSPRSLASSPRLPLCDKLARKIE